MQVLTRDSGDAGAADGFRCKRKRVERVIAAGAFRIVYQPIFHLLTGRICGLEALTRFESRFIQSPQLWFRDANEVGLCAELETATLGRAVRALEVMPRGTFLSLNVSAHTLLTCPMAEVLSGYDPHRITLELTEHSPVGNYRTLQEAIAPLRRTGVRLAVDDVGSGYADLQHLVHLEPDFIKLDIDLTSGLGANPARTSLTAGLIGFARAIGCQVIAEGVETAEQLPLLRRLGIPMAQGFYLGRPLETS